MASASYTGRVGRTGGVTGPHLHLGFMVDGQYHPLSEAGRAIAGTRIQFKKPNSDTWESLYQDFGQGRPGLHPSVQISDPFGVRAVHPVTGKRNVPHRGEDYNLPEGTMLRVLGEGTVTPLANVGAAGNMSRFTSRTLDNRPFTLEFMHLSELPQQTATGQQEAAGTPPPAPELPPREETKEEVEKRTFEELLKGQLQENLLSKVLNRSSSNAFEAFMNMAKYAPQSPLTNPLFSQEAT